MANLWEKVKLTLEQSAKKIRETTETTTKSVAETATKVASTVAEKSKDIATTIGDKTHAVVTVGQLKIKHYNLNRDVSHKFNELGARAYELIKSENINVFGDANLKSLINDVKRMESEIDQLEAEMEEAKSKQSDQEARGSAADDMNKTVT